MSAQTGPENAIEREKTSHALAMFAKLLCSGSFVVGRDPTEFFEHDIKTHVRPEGNPFGWDEVEVEVHHNRQEVTLSAHGISRTARCHGGQGCTILPEGTDDVHFMPEPVVPHVPDPETTLWPMGDLLPDEPLPPEVDVDALEAAFDFALDDDARPKPQKTRGLVVLYKDRLIGERYAPGFTKDTRQISWSSGKSITSALIGLLVKDGHFSVDQPAPIAEWQGDDDPRREIKIADLLQMSSGLDFVRAQDEDRLELGWTSRDDHMYIYFGAVNVFEHSISRPLEYPPGTVWRYRNGDPLTLGALVRRTVEGRGEDYLTFPQRALFDKLGMRNMVLETDPWGNFIMSGYDYGTPARLGAFRTAASPRRCLAGHGRTHPPRRLGRLHQHPGSSSRRTAVRRPVLAQRRWPIPGYPPRCLLGARRMGPGHDGHPLPRHGHRPPRPRPVRRRLLRHLPERRLWPDLEGGEDRMTREFSTLSFQIVGMDMRSQGAGRGIRQYPEYIVDGVPLVSLLRSNTSGSDFETGYETPIRHQVNIPTLAWPLDVDAFDRLTLQRDPALSSTGRYVILCCELCGDPGCGVVSADISRDGDVVTWRRFGSESSLYDQEHPDESWYEPDAFPWVGPFLFEWEPYITTLQEMREVAARLWNEYVSTR